MATILIVDDTENIRSLLSDLLSADHNILEASNGQEGLMVYEKYKPDLVITDLSMPIMSGIEMVRRIRSLSSEIKIIAHSTFYDSSLKREMTAAGATLCLTKPTSIESIERAVYKLLLG
jgi:two-component system, chemotaxis family, chemotaxis protein CheY